MDRRSYGRGQPRSSYRPRNLSSGNRSSNVGAQNPNPNYRSSNFDTSVDGNHVGGEGGGDGYRSSLVSGNSQRDELDDGQRPGNLVGTCTLMCPVRERAQRERLRDLSVFERLNGDPTKSSPSLAVKKFCRTISTNEASDLRPLSVLEDTLKYLLSLVDNSDHPFEVVHDFVFDRIRSIRQDLSIQNLDNIRAIHMYEEMIRVEVNVLHGPSAKKVALAAAKDLGATWVILDRQMKKDKRYFMEELPTCKISRLKRDNTMEELRGAKLSGETALQRSIAKNVSYGEMIPGTPNDSPDRVTAAVELGMSRNVSYGEKVPGTPDDDPPESWRLWVGEGS